MQPEPALVSVQPWWTRYRNAMLIALLALVVMLPAIGHDFINWDDNRLIGENTAVTTTDGIFTIWSSLELPRQYPNYPLTLTSYWIEHQLWGMHPTGYHIVNMLLHAVNAVLVLLLLRRLGLKEMAAMLATALFAAHPMQVESVAWVSERKNLLFTLFSLLSMLAYMKFLDTNSRKMWALALLAFVTALLSKTSAVTVPCTLLATAWLKRDRITRRDVLALVPFFMVALTAGLITAGVEPTPRGMIPFMERPLLAVNTLAFYLARLVFPVTVVPVHPKWDFEPGGVFLIAPIVLIVVMAMMFRSRHTLPKLVGWGAVHFLVSLGPFLGLISFAYHETTFVADRYVYFASFGLFAPLAVGIVHVLSRFDRKTAVMTCSGYVAVMAIVTLVYVPVWRNSFTLWNYTLKHNPDCSRAHNNLGTVYEQRGEIDKALAHYVYAMQVDPMLSSAPSNVAMTMVKLGQLDEAESHYMRAISIDPANWKIHYRLACVYIQQGRYEDGLVHLRIASRIDPANAEVYNVAGFAHEKLGHLDTAESLYRKAVKLDPNHPLAAKFLAALHARQGESMVTADDDRDLMP